MENLLQTIREERTRFGATLSHDECARLCNAVAWRHRAQGFGVSAKSGGTYGTLPNGVRIAHDILHHLPSNQLVDILTAAGEASIPAWQPVGPPQSADRVWVAPVDPATFGPAPVAPQPPVVGPSPVTGPDSAVLDAVQALAARLDLLAHNGRLTAEGVQRLEAALAAGLPLRLKARLLGDVTGTLGGPTR